MRYNQRSDDERDRLQSEKKQEEAERGYLDARVKALEAEYESLQAAASGIADRIAQTREAARSPQPSVSLEDRVSAGEGSGDGLEALTRQLHAVQAQLGHVQAELSGTRGAIAQSVAKSEALKPRARDLLERDSDLERKISRTRYGVQTEASGISGENADVLEGVDATLGEYQRTVAAQVPPDAQLLSELEGFSAGFGTSSGAPGHINVDAIYPPRTYGEAKYHWADHIELSFQTPPAVYGYWGNVPEGPAAKYVPQATPKVPSVLQRGAVALPTYVTDVLYKSPPASNLTTAPPGLQAVPDLDLTRLYQPLQKVGEIAYDRTKSVGKSVVQYVTQAASYLTSAIGSYLGRER